MRGRDQQELIAWGQRIAEQMPVPEDYSFWLVEVCSRLHRYPRLYARIHRPFWRGLLSSLVRGHRRTHQDETLRLCRLLEQVPP